MLEVSTLLRWVLRAFLVVSLVYIFMANKQQEEEEAESVEERPEPTHAYQCGKGKGRNTREPSYARNDAPYQRNRHHEREGQRTNFGDRRNNNFGMGNFLKDLSKSTKAGNNRQSAEMSSFLYDISKSKGQSTTTNSTFMPNGSDVVLTKRPPLKLKDPDSNNTKKVGDLVLNAHSRPITHLSFSKDKTMLVTCSKDKTVLVWSMPSGERIGACAGHRGAVWSCSITANSTWLVSCGADGLVIVWKPSSCVKIAEVELTGVVKCVAWAQHDSEEETSEQFALASNKFGSSPAGISLWAFDGSNATKIFSIDQPKLPSPATQLCWGHKDKVLISSHEEGKVLFWDSGTGDLLETLNAHAGPLSLSAPVADSTLIATCGHTDMCLRLWDISGKGADEMNEAEEGKPACKLVREHVTGQSLKCVALRPSLTRKEATIGGSRRDLPCECITGGGQDVREVALVGQTSEQFETLLFRVGVAESKTLEPYVPEERVRGHFGPIHTLAFSPDGSTFASGSEDGCVRLHRILSVEAKNDQPRMLARRDRPPPPNTR